MSAKTKYYNTGGGELFFAPIVNGVMQGETAFGETENVGFSSEIETLNHNNSEGSVVVEDKVILKKIIGKLSIESIEISPEMLSRAFLADDKSTDVVSGTDTTDNINVKFLDSIIELSKQRVSKVVVKKGSDVKTEGTDYTVDVVNGYIIILSGGTIAVSDDIEVTFDNEAYKDIRLEAFINGKLEGKLRFVSHASNGLSYVYLFHKVSLLASGDFSLKSPDEFAKISFEGSMLADESVTGSGESKLFVIKGNEV